jgi:hypothetical protein
VEGGDWGVVEFLQLGQAVQGVGDVEVLDVEVLEDELWGESELERRYLRWMAFGASCVMTC